MIDWDDEAIVLSARKHGETSVIASLFARQHGRRRGYIRGGTGKRARGLLQPGNVVLAKFRARLEEHLGNFQVEPLRALAAMALESPVALTRLSAACAVADATLPEDEPHPDLFRGLLALLEALDAPDWEAYYVRWEAMLLADLGYGLDLSACAVTGATADLAYVSPKTGRAVSRAAGRPYHDRLFALPAFLVDEDATAGPADMRAGLGLTGWFLERHVLSHRAERLPAARTRLVDRLSR